MFGGTGPLYPAIGKEQVGTALLNIFPLRFLNSIRHVPETYSPFF